jgi:MoaA/NifB/PqqE/SkfB family radical SAM enzyme
MSSPEHHHIVLRVTPNCNLHCRHCFVDSSNHSQRPALDTATLREIVAQIAEAGFREVRLSGGEPFLREDLKGLCAFIRERGLSFRITTNGTLIGSREAAWLADFGVNRLVVTVHHIDPQSHDAFAGVQGAHHCTMRSIEMAIAQGLPVETSICVTQWNRDGLIDSLRRLDHIGLWGVRLSILSPLGRVRAEWENLMLNNAEWRRVWKEVTVHRAEYRHLRIRLALSIAHRESPRECEEATCSIGSTCSAWSISNTGELYPCCLIEGNSSFLLAKLPDQPLVSALQPPSLATLSAILQNQRCQCEADSGLCRGGCIAYRHDVGPDPRCGVEAGYIPVCPLRFIEV